ncbi:MAG: sensor histidine kinase, partial [Oligoflexia bacterium]|nr:sensor histidine kinase [Oligoflexia bacterium]
MTLWLHTLRALAEPRRAVPIGVVSAAMIYAQQWFTRDLLAVALAFAMASYFLAVAPWAWRRLFPPGAPIRLDRLALYVIIGGVPSVMGWLVPRWSGLGATFLTAGVNALVVATLFWVGGWGLARDIDLEGGMLRAQARAEDMARQAEQAQLLALRAHLDPHFLFNTLNAIAEWTREDPAVAEAAILRLSKLLRQVTEGVRVPSWPLARELDLARAVWDLYAIRDPERFVIQWQVPQPVPAVEVPPLVLLPVVENAVKHGPAAGHNGVLRLEVQGHRVTVSNPGPYTGPRRGGEGLELVRRRLHLACGDAARFDIKS